MASTSPSVSFVSSPFGVAMLLPFTRNWRKLFALPVLASYTYSLRSLPYSLTSCLRTVFTVAGLLFGNLRVSSLLPVISRSMVKKRTETCNA